MKINSRNSSELLKDVTQKVEEVGDIMRNMTKKDNKINPVVAGVAGAVVAAGVTVAATKVLSNNKTRKKIKTAISDAKNQAIDYVKSRGAPKVAQKSKIVTPKRSSIKKVTAKKK